MNDADINGYIQITPQRLKNSEVTLLRDPKEN